jgi:hypothetical protein
MKEEDSASNNRRRDNRKTKAALGKDMVRCRNNFNQTFLPDDVTNMEDV